MEDIKSINRFCGFTLLPAFLLFTSIGIYGTIYFGEIPEYGKHADPHSLGIKWIGELAIPFVFVSLFAIPAAVLLNIHFLLNKIRYTKYDLLSVSALFFSLSGFVTLHYLFPGLFNWIMD